ncbi:MAG: FAD-dependent oxidoreductase [Rhodospirillales bacterium]|jgi:NADPH-dependent 2,4-dienoyl-CoA reductase/sulfur reductase-like enzyme|nr:FAD-dependent oxidoreductase [Rhodospirillales bacterium]
MIDLIIIGAGPAGMSAALEASSYGLDVTILNEGPEPGGRIYHALERLADHHPDDVTRLGNDYAEGLNLIKAFHSCAVTLINDAAVFRLDEDGTVWYTHDDAAKTIKAKAVLIATGAMERPVPIPAWTLPGVMTAGAAQMLLKGDGMIPSGPVAMAGCGPLLILTACQLLDAGADVRCVIDTVQPKDYLASLPALLGALKAPFPLLKGIALRKKLAKSGVELISGATSLSISGIDHATGIFVNGRHIDADTILLHNGVVPETQLSRQVGCEHVWNNTQRCWHPDVDEWGESSLKNIHIVGDGGGIEGALAAWCSGRLSALNIAKQLGKINKTYRDKLARPWQKARRKHLNVRPFLDRLFKPAEFLLAPTNKETVICRCEEVRLRAVLKASDLGCPGPNQLKSFTRAGMGPCQGRLCGLTVSEILAKQKNTSPANIGYYTIRPPVKPVTLSQLAKLDQP